MKRGLRSIRGRPFVKTDRKISINALFLNNRFHFTVADYFFVIYYPVMPQACTVALNQNYWQLFHHLYLWLKTVTSPKYHSLLAIQITKGVGSPFAGANVSQNHWRVGFQSRFHSNWHAQEIKGNKPRKICSGTVCIYIKRNKPVEIWSGTVIHVITFETLMPDLSYKITSL